MKKTLIALAAAVGLAATGYSQGNISFNDQNINSGVVDYNAAPSATTGAGNYNLAATFTIQLWYIATASAPTAASEGADGFGYLTAAQFNGDGYTLGATAPTGSGGLFDNGSALSLTGTTGGNPALIAIVAWDGTFANLATALANNAHVGIITFQNPTSASGNPTVPQLTGWDALTPTAAAAAYSSTKAFGGSDLILSPVPEPTTLALAGLGGAALLAFRRRKA